ncbi:4'-phosphopantetheinyl transferase superfamily protein, partial [Corynebacterium durum]
MPPVTPAIGIDLVHIPSFAEQLRQPGSRFHRVFSAFERRHANQKLDPDQHLAGRWAAKEAFVKA